MKEGDLFSNKYGEYKVSKLLPNGRCIIEWINYGCKCEVERWNAKIGQVKPILKDGCVKYENHFPTKINGKHTRYYEIWMSMKKRCGKPNISYSDCTVCDEWYDFQKFANWYHERYKEGYHLDKDILVKGNRVYSPDTCCLVPREINIAFMRGKSRRGKCPIGVYFDKGNNCYQARICMYSTPCYLGSYDNYQDAFYIYKKTKEHYIKSLAYKYKGEIEPKVYDALMSYEVEMTD